MGGGGFLLLNAGYSGLESSKQAEIRLSILLKILQIRLLRQFPFDMANSPHGCDFVNHIAITLF
jgi:hypothetical protein